MDLRIGTFQTKDGLKLHYEHWSPLLPKGTIVFLHGMGDHSGRYGPFIDYFTKRDYQVFLYDQRGHGRSEGPRVFVEKFDSLVDDLASFLQFSFNEPSRKRPVFLVGHSFGGQVALNFLARYPHRFKAACVVSPSLEVALELPQWMEKISRMVLPVWPKMRLKNLTKPDLLSHDPAVVQNYKKDPLVSSYVTIGIGKELLDNLEWLFSAGHQIQTPLFMFHGLEDHYCSVEGTKRFFKELRLEKKRLKLYEGMYHELLNETKKEEVFREIENWFDFIGFDRRPSRKSRRLPFRTQPIHAL